MAPHSIKSHHHALHSQSHNSHRLLFRSPPLLAHLLVDLAVDGLVDLVVVLVAHARLVGCHVDGCLGKVSWDTLCVGGNRLGRGNVRLSVALMFWWSPLLPLDELSPPLLPLMADLALSIKPDIVGLFVSWLGLSEVVFRDVACGVCVVKREEG